MKKKYHYLTDQALKPIILSRNEIAQIFIYSRPSNWLEIQLEGENLPDTFNKTMQESAREFIRQLRGHWCKTFMIALKKEINDAIKDRSGADFMRHNR